MSRCIRGDTPQRANHSGYQDERGVTLAETLVAIAIISMTFVAFMSATSTASIASRVYAEGVTAIGIARSQMEHTQNAIYVPPPHTYESIPVPPRFSVTSEAQDYNGDTNLEKIVVTLYRDGEVVQILEDLKVNQ